MSVDVSQGQDLKQRILSGVNKLAEAVTSTLGPGGRNVLIRREDGSIGVTKDGVSVAKAFESLSDPIEDTAVQMCKTVAQKAVDKVGDGTTTATLLAQAIVNEGFKAIEADSNPIQVKVGVDKAVAAVVAKLKAMSEDITTEEQIMQVAMLSANGDEQIAKLITQALDYVGDEGAVSIEESRTGGESTLEKVEGMVFDRGYKTPYFSTDDMKMEAQLSNPYILITQERLVNNDQVVNLLNYVAGQNRPLLVIAEDIDSEALSTMIVNKVRNLVKVCAVKAPEFGDRRTAFLEDIAVMTGGTVISETKGMHMRKIKQADFKNYLGECRNVTVTARDTTIVDGKPVMIKEEDGFEEDGVTVKYKEINPVEKRLKEIKAQLDKAKSAFEIENLQTRISKLTGGVAIINVGGLSEVEMKERKDRVDDALHATKAAIMEGVVPGGGMALINCEEALDSLVLANLDQMIGREIVRKVLYAPFNKILTNAGVDNPNDILDQIRGGFIYKQKSFLGIKYKSLNWVVRAFTEDSIWNGYNVKTGEFVNLKEAGVIDPAKVTRTALENAASIAGTILTTTAAVFELPNQSGASADQGQYM